MLQIRENIIDKIYRKKAKSLSVSLKLIYCKNTYDGINIIHMMKRSMDKEDFSKYARWEIKKKRNTDFFHHSLIMGMYFDYYNIYPYMYISQNIRNQLSFIKPNKEKTIKFLKNYNYEIYNYFKEKYNIEYNSYIKITKGLFKECSNLNYPIFFDYSKILMGNDLYIYNHNNNNFIGCNNCIKYFDNLNIIEKKLIKK